MKRRPLFFYAPDDGAPAAGASPAAVPVSAPTIPAASPTPKVEPVNIPAHKGVIDAAKSLGLAMPGIQGPKEAGFEDANETLASMEKAMGGKERPRDETGKFVVDKTAVKEVAAAKPAKAKPAPKPVAPAPVVPPIAPVAKVKIGDKEMTPEEVAKYVADLEAKAKPPEPAKPDVPATPTDDDRKKQEEAFYETASTAYTPTPDEFDSILAGGPEAVKSFGRALSKVDLSARKWMESQLNPILDSIDKRMQPLLAQQNQIQQYTRENNFLAANPDIKAHAQGLEESRKVEAALQEKRGRIQRLISASAATAQEIEFAKTYDTSTPEQLQEDIAFHTRQRLGIKPGAEPVPVAPVAPVPAAPVAAPIAPAAPKPFNGDRPGGHSSQVNESADARAAREMNAHQGI